MNLFCLSVHAISSDVYTATQLHVWVPKPALMNTGDWCRSLTENYTLVAVATQQEIVGFDDIDDTGYLNRLYVHPNYQRQGIASRLMSN